MWAEDVVGSPLLTASTGTTKLTHTCWSPTRSTTLYSLSFFFILHSDYINCCPLNISVDCRPSVMFTADQEGWVKAWVRRQVMMMCLLYSVHTQDIIYKQSGPVLSQQVHTGNNL